MAEWLCSGLQSRERRFDSGFSLQRIMNIVVFGAGYVGMSIGTMLSIDHNVSFVEIDTQKRDLINQNKCSYDDQNINDYLLKNNCKINACLFDEINFDEFISILALPTNYIEETNSFDTSILDETIKLLSTDVRCKEIVIKSTIPIGYTAEISSKLKIKNIFFSPEFLRENSSLNDNLYPSRLIIGNTHEDIFAFNYETAVKEAILLEKEFLRMTSNEAESVKLFSNTYLALRVAFFNELDTFALKSNISSENLIKGISSDERIGDHYNNPSFGYGGYCLPKDTKQLSSQLQTMDLVSPIISSIDESNKTRKKTIFQYISSINPKSIGIYSIEMKLGSSNSREAAILDIINLLKNEKVKIYLFNPNRIPNNLSLNEEISLSEFIKKSEIIIANRIPKELEEYSHKVFSRDVFYRD